MSKQAAKDFLDKVDQDPALQAKLKEVHSNIVSLAKENGYEFSHRDLHGHMRERWGVKNPPQYADPDTCTICIF